MPIEKLTTESTKEQPSEHTIELSSGDSVVVKQVSEDEFDLISFDGGGIGDNPSQLAYTQWDESVTNLDHDSDVAQCFKWSDRLEWEDVILMTDGFIAPSLDRLKEALQHVTLNTYDPDEI